MEAEQILNWCLEHLEGTVLMNSWGETGVFYNPGHVLKRGIYVLTIKEKDGKNDQASQLDRPGMYRVNLGPRKQTYVNLFGSVPKRPPKGGVVELEMDFAQTDILLPHPVYAWMGWVCTLNPSKHTFEELKPLILESYEFAKEKFAKRKNG
ncbi:DUF6194 family protein [Oscillospiraceae bacterium 44-34]